MNLTTDPLLLPFFILNWILVLVDASLGYHLAPHLPRLTPQPPDSDQQAFVRSIRRMLTGVVLLYMFFNCLAYFRHDTTLMAVVTVVVLLDLGGQLYVRYRVRRRERDDA